MNAGDGSRHRGFGILLVDEQMIRPSELMSGRASSLANILNPSPFRSKT